MNIEFKLPELGENIESGDVVRVLVREGDTIAGNDGVIELETEKAVVEIPCPNAGKIVKIHVTKGQTVKVGQPVLSLETADRVEPQAAAATAPAAESAPSSPPPKGERAERKGEAAEREAALVPAGPEARRLARELNVDLARIRGSGKGGRITVEDVRAAAVAPTLPAERPQAGPVPVAEETQSAPVPGQPGQDAYGPVRRERMSRIRRSIAAQMVKSASTIPHVTNFDDADVTELEQLRKTIPSGSLGPGRKLTTLAFVIRAVALSLRQHPVLNASIDEGKEEIVYKDYVNLGVAVDTPRGLVVPAIRHVDRMDLLQIAGALTALAARARAAEFTLDELRGGTFTISNLGAIGGTYSTPIINHPEVAILLLGRSRWLLAARGENENIEKRLMMPLSLSYDHRVVDGAAAARFLGAVIDYLQSPGKLLLAK
jgi:pyruvate/2-oxoglutarate dehydrogenase complex dihydrolipoamide acyltransferase (E2) component